MRRSTTISTIELRKSRYGFLERFTTAMPAPAVFVSSAAAPIGFLTLITPSSPFFFLPSNPMCFLVSTDTSGRKASPGAGSPVLLGSARRVGARRAVVLLWPFLVLLR